MDIDKAIRVVESAGYTVTNDKQLIEYYAAANNTLNAQLERAMKGDWLAAEDILKRVNCAPGHVTYSQPIMSFIAFIAQSLLSRRNITSAKNSNKRLKNPLLAAVLKTDSRKDYALENKKRQLKHRHEFLKEYFKDKEIKPTGEFNEFMALSENIPIDQYEKYIKSAKKIE